MTSLFFSFATFPTVQRRFLVSNTDEIHVNLYYSQILGGTSFHIKLETLNVTHAFLAISCVLESKTNFR